jgi:hypothetical protein
MKPNQEFKNLLGVPSNTFYILEGNSIGSNPLSPGTTTDKLHTITSTTTLQVVGSGIVRLFMVGAGSNGAAGSQGSSSGKGGNGGKVIVNNSYSLTEGLYSVVINGGQITFNSLVATRGGGAAGGAARTTTGNGNSGNTGTTTNIRYANPATTNVFGNGGGAGAYNTAPSSINYYYGGVGPNGAGDGGYSPGSGGAAGDGISAAGGYGDGGGGGAADTNMSNSNTYGGNGSGALFIIRYTPKG